MAAQLTAGMTRACTGEITFQPEGTGELLSISISPVFSGILLFIAVHF
jgi:hypothetical protein